MFLYLFHPFGFESLIPFLWVLRCASWFIVLCAGLGFVTSLLFVFLVGVFVSSWLGATVFWIGEWFIKRMPFVRHLYSASKQISSAISPGKEKITCLICLRFISRNYSKCKSCHVLFHWQTRDCPSYRTLMGFVIICSCPNHLCLFEFYTLCSLQTKILLLLRKWQSYVIHVWVNMHLALSLLQLSYRYYCSLIGDISRYYRAAEFQWCLQIMNMNFKVDHISTLGTK